MQIKAAETASATWWNTTRKIITYKEGAQIPFRWGSLSGPQKTALDPGSAGDGSSDLLNWLRGDRDEESTSGGFRVRLNLLGDVVHANPVYVGRPNAGYAANDYANWAETLNARAPRVYSGHNDGMLHVFDAATGNEVYAYVPSMLFENLSILASRPFNHTYFVDGKLTAADAFISSNWRTILAGTLGAGGKGVFVLDVTDPDLNSEGSSSASDQKIILEYAGDDDLGYTFSKPLIVQMNDGKWYVVIGNGYASANGEAMLMAINLETGAVTKIGTSSGDSTDPNGLSSPALIDEDRDGKIDIAYAGDLEGQMWKFDLSSSSPGSWNVAFSGNPLYAGTSDQPITTAPDVAAHPAGGFLIAFATGRLLTALDVGTATAQAIVGIQDDESTPPGAADLAGKLLTIPWVPATYTRFDVATSTFTSDTEQVSLILPDAGDVDWENQFGWKQTLPSGLLALDDVQIRAGRVKSTLVSPTLTETWIVENVYLDGGPELNPIYDLNRDGTLTYYDRFGAPGFVTAVPMAWERGPGLLSRATIGRVSNGADAIFLNRLEPVFSSPCETGCTGGFQGGHMDVDTWDGANAIDDGSTKHTHEYDKPDNAARVYVDAFEVNAGDVDGHVDLYIKDDSWLPCDAGDGDGDKKKKDKDKDKDGGDNGGNDCFGNDQEFVVLVANADFSPGSNMSIGTRSMNVVAYQRLIHQALKGWTDPDADPVDSDGNSLIYTLPSLRAGGGTLRHSFDDIALIAGGLHPTSTGCVKGDPDDSYDMDTLVGRWRNGALTTQLLDTDYLRDQLRAGTISSAIEGVNIQKPWDLIENLQLPSGEQGDLVQDFDGNDVIEESNHERMGGLLAKNTAERLWELTLFWHYGGDCYGEENWFQDRIDEMIETLEEDPDGSASIAALEAAALLASCPDTDAGCDPQTYIDEALKAVFESLLGVGGTPGVGGGDGETGTIIGGDFESTRTTGPASIQGRQSWTDVVLQ